MARVTPAMDRPRGPDVQMTVRVPGAWLRQGATVEVTLPRNVSCAVCHGGGCDACERSGALSLRGRKEPPEILEVTLPSTEPGEQGRDRAVLVRIPDRGGFPEEGSDLPRGNLLLSVRPGSEAGPGVTRVEQAALAPREPSERPARPGAPRPLSPPAAFALGGLIAVVAWLLWLLWTALRATFP